MPYMVRVEKEAEAIVSAAELEMFYDLIDSSYTEQERLQTYLRTNTYEKLYVR